MEPVSVTTEPPVVDNGPDDDTLDTLGDAYVIVAVDDALDRPTTLMRHVRPDPTPAADVH